MRNRNQPNSTNGHPYCILDTMVLMAKTHDHAYNNLGTAANDCDRIATRRFHGNICNQSWRMPPGATVPARFTSIIVVSFE